MTEVGRLLPDVDNPVLHPHWEGAAHQRLVIPFCASCGAAQWPPRPNCLQCHDFDFEWREVPSAGVLFSYFTAHKPLHPSVADEVPYTAGVIELPVGVKMLGRLVGIAPEDVTIGMPMRAAFVERAPGVTLVWWEPDTEHMEP